MKSRKTRTLVALWWVVISGFLLMATSFAEDKKEIKLDFENAIQTIPEIIFKPSLRDTNHVELKNEIWTKLIRIITNGNSFLLKKHGEGSSVEGSGSTVLWWVSNSVDNSHYSTIVAWSNNQISNSTHATIGWWSGNRVSGDYWTVAGGENNVAQKYSAVVWGKDNVAGWDYSVVLWNSNETHGSYSVAMWSDAIVNGDRSFLWNDGSAEKTLVWNDMFAVNGASGMVVNATKAHRFAQLTIWWSLSINDSNAAVECKPWVLKVVNRPDIANQVCFCSCDGTKWNSLFGGWKCNRICDSTSPEVSCDNNSATKICEGSNISYSGGCLVWEVVQWTGAFLVDNKGELHWTCQTRDGSQEQCHGKIKTTKWTCNDPKWTFVCTGKPNHAEFLPWTDSGLTDNTGPTLYNTRAEAQADTTKKCRWYCEDGYYLEWDYCLKKKPCNGCPSGEVESGLTCESYSKWSVTSPENCPEKVISTCDNGRWDTEPWNYLSCTKYYRSCTSSACGTKSDGASCTTYDRCSSTPITSVCNDGTWSRTPWAYSSPNQWCNWCSSSACGSRTNGQSCTTYDRCSSTPITSVCNDGTWSRTPWAYSSPNQWCNWCPASGWCPAASNGQSCTSYAKCSTTSKTSTCVDGSWSNTPYGYSAANQGCDNLSCTGCPGKSSVSHGWTCTSYAKCSSTAITSTCNNGTWSRTPWAYSAANQGCDNLSCTGCPGKSSVSHGWTCTSYAACSSTAITSTCSNGTWSRAPWAYSSPNQGLCDYDCGWDLPDQDGILAGKSTYNGSYTPTDWTYVEYNEYDSNKACVWTCNDMEWWHYASPGCLYDGIRRIPTDRTCDWPCWSAYSDESLTCYKPWVQCISTSTTAPSETRTCSNGSWNSSFTSTYTDSAPNLSSKTCSATTYPLTTEPDATNGTKSSCTEYSQNGTQNACKKWTTRYKLTCNAGYQLNSAKNGCEPIPVNGCTWPCWAADSGKSLTCYKPWVQCTSTSTTAPSETRSCSNGSWNSSFTSTYTDSAPDLSSKTCSSTTYPLITEPDDTNGTKSSCTEYSQNGTNNACKAWTTRYKLTCNNGYQLNSNGTKCEPKWCSADTRTKGSCTFSIPALSNGDSTTKTYTTSPYYGTTTATCTNGSLSYTSESCITVCGSSGNPVWCNGSFSATYPSATWLSSYNYTCKYWTLSYSCSATCPTGTYWFGSQCKTATSICDDTHNGCVNGWSYVSNSAGSTSTTYTWKCKRGDYTQDCTESKQSCPSGYWELWTSNTVAEIIEHECGQRGTDWWELQYNGTANGNSCVKCRAKSCPQWSSTTCNWQVLGYAWESACYKCTVTPPSSDSCTEEYDFVPDWCSTFESCNYSEWTAGNAKCESSAGNGWSCYFDNESRYPWWLHPLCSCWKSRACKDCTAPWWATVKHGSSVTAYLSSSSSTCTSQSRQCTDGKLSWSYQYQSCTKTSWGWWGWWGCFLAGTPVITSEWSKNIEDIEVGDKVLSYSEDTKTFEYNVVNTKWVFEDNTDDIYELAMWDDVLQVTALHRFFVVRTSSDEYQCKKSYIWDIAKRLQVWDQLMMNDGSYVTIDEISHHEHNGTVYNLWVDNVHNFFVGEWYLVHNIQSNEEKAMFEDYTWDWWSDCWRHWLIDDLWATAWWYNLCDGSYSIY